MNGIRIALPYACHGLLEDHLPLVHLQKLDLRADHVGMAGGEVEHRKLCLDYDLVYGHVAYHRTVEVLLHLPVRDAYAARRVALRVHVHQQRPALGHGHRGRQVDRSGRLPHTALLVSDRYDLSHRQHTLAQNNLSMEPFCKRRVGTPRLSREGCSFPPAPEESPAARQAFPPCP